MIHLHRSTRYVFQSLVALSLVGCGPSVSEVRLGSAPGRPTSCELAFRKFEMNEISPDGPYEVLGHVVLRSEAFEIRWTASFAQRFAPAHARWEAR